MTNSEVSSCHQNYCFSKFHNMHDTGTSESKDNAKERFNSSALVSREERVALLKSGFTGKDIESEYLKRNNIAVIGVKWQD